MQTGTEPKPAKGRTLGALAMEIERQAEAKMDFVADTGSLAMVAVPRPLEVTENQETPDVEYDVKLRVETTVRDSYPVKPLAHAQIGETMDIPKKYYDRMLAEAPGLLVNNVNHWFQEKPKRRLIRTLDGKARAFLSDTYRRRDNVDLMKYVLPEVFPQDRPTPWIPQSQEVTERRMYIKLVNSELNGIVNTSRAVDDKVYGGLVISNSEVACGSTRIEPMIWWKWCTNGAIITKLSNRKVHLGKRLDEGVQEFLSDEALQAADEAYFLMIRDAIRHFSDQEVFVGIVEEIQRTTDREVVGSVEKGVEVLAQTIGLTSKETEGTLRRFYENSSRYGLTQYGLLNAVTNLAQTATSYDRNVELETAGSKIIDLTTEQWREIAEVAA